MRAVRIRPRFLLNVFAEGVKMKIKDIWPYIVAASSLFSHASPSIASSDSPPSRVIGKILMADCSQAIVKSASKELEDMCVVVYSGSIMETSPDGALTATETEGNVGFASESTGVLNFVGKHVELRLKGSSAVISSVSAPE